MYTIKKWNSLDLNYYLNLSVLVGDHFVFCGHLKYGLFYKVANNHFRMQLTKYKINIQSTLVTSNF